MQQQKTVLSLFLVLLFTVSLASANIFQLNKDSNMLTGNVVAEENPMRVSFWQGKVNQHYNFISGEWVTDPDGVSGASYEQSSAIILEYCKKFYPSVSSIEYLGTESISGWKDFGNKGDYTSTKPVYACNSKSDPFIFEDGFFQGEYAYCKSYGMYDDELELNGNWYDSSAIIYDCPYLEGDMGYRLLPDVDDVDTRLHDYLIAIDEYMYLGDLDYSVTKVSGFSGYFIKMINEKSGFYSLLWSSEDNILYATFQDLDPTMDESANGLLLLYMQKYPSDLPSDFSLEKEEVAGCVETDSLVISPEGVSGFEVNSDIKTLYLEESSTYNLRIDGHDIAVVLETANEEAGVFSVTVDGRKETFVVSENTVKEVDGFQFYLDDIFISTIGEGSKSARINYVNRYNSIINLYGESTCYNDNVRNYYCSNDEVTYTTRSCTYGCAGGACLPEPVVEQECFKAGDFLFETQGVGDFNPVTDVDYVHLSQGEVVEVFVDEQKATLELIGGNLDDNSAIIRVSSTEGTSIKTLQAGDTRKIAGVELLVANIFISVSDQSIAADIFYLTKDVENLNDWNQEITCSGNDVANFYCSGDDLKYDLSPCDYGCSNGACSPKPVDYCEDADDINTFSRGEVTFDGNTYMDECVTGPSGFIGVRETLCVADGISTIDVSCENGCSNGACINEPSCNLPGNLETDGSFVFFRALNEDVTLVTIEGQEYEVQASVLSFDDDIVEVIVREVPNYGKIGSQVFRDGTLKVVAGLDVLVNNVFVSNVGGNRAEFEIAVKKHNTNANLNNWNVYYSCSDEESDVLNTYYCGSQHEVVSVASVDCPNGCTSGSCIEEVLPQAFFFEDVNVNPDNWIVVNKPNAESWEAPSTWVDFSIMHVSTGGDTEVSVLVSIPELGLEKSFIGKTSYNRVSDQLSLDIPATVASGKYTVLVEAWTDAAGKISYNDTIDVVQYEELTCKDSGSYPKVYFGNEVVRSGEPSCCIHCNTAPTLVGPNMRTYACEGNMLETKVISCPCVFDSCQGEEYPSDYYYTSSSSKKVGPYDDKIGVEYIYSTYVELKVDGEKEFLEIGETYRLHSGLEITLEKIYYDASVEENLNVAIISYEDAFDIGDSPCIRAGYLCTSPIRGCGQYDEVDLSCGDYALCCEDVPRCGDDVCFKADYPYGETIDNCPEDCDDSYEEMRLVDGFYQGRQGSCVSDDKVYYDDWEIAGDIYESASLDYDCNTGDFAFYRYYDIDNKATLRRILAEIEQEYSLSTEQLDDVYGEENTVIFAEEDGETVVIWMNHDGMFVFFVEDVDDFSSEDTDVVTYLLESYLSAYPSVLDEDFSVDGFDCDGCMSGDACLPYGIRMSGEYCALDGDFTDFKTAGDVCENNFECSTNFCLDGTCVEKGFFQKLLDFFQKYF